MKKITLLFAFLITSIGFSQTELITNGDFSSGADSWGGSAFTVVSGEAYFSSTNAGGNPWDTQLTQGGMSFVNSQEYTLTFKARAAADRPITVAIQNVGVWDDQFRQDFNLTTVMTEFTATFNATSDNDNVQIGFLMAGAGYTDAIYYDDISIVTSGTVPETCSDGIMNQDETGIDCGGTICPPCPEPPAVAAPTPPARAAADVVSIYSDAYTSISPINLDAGWCGSPAISEVMIDSNPTLQYLDQACQGIDFSSALQDLTGFTYIHVDLFIQGGTDLVGKVFNLKAVPTAGAESEFPIDINALSPAPVPGTWYSYDEPITFSGPTVDIMQFGVTSNLNNVVWYDNLYFHKNTTLGTEDFAIEGLKVFPNPSKDVWNVSTKDQKLTSIQVFDILGKQVLSLKPNAVKATIDASNLSKGLYFARINAEVGSSTLKLIKD